MKKYNKTTHKRDNPKQPSNQTMNKKASIHFSAPLDNSN